MVDFAVEALDDVTLDISRPDGLLAGYDLMSPYVWTDPKGCHLLVRVLPDPLKVGDPTGIIYSGEADASGLNFVMDPHPAIAPGPAPDDAKGVEDPTVVIAADSEVLVYYTGVHGDPLQGCMMVARGLSLTELVKERVVLKAPEGEGNIKEATVAQGADGRFRLFYEYAKDNASRIGMAVGPGPDGPWEVVADPFTVREGSWDNWHLSTGPVVNLPGMDPVMFYNGATADARWRIGWIAFDANFTRVTARGLEPLIVPPPPEHRDGTDIAFAASALVEEGDTIRLYYSLEDRILRRATVRAFHG
ncbi:glycoside hydrolase family protein [Tsuneonella amylolytica]|uniref:glycosidase n=1 Tax=Tsuneonella amylolytica TaxID=2338327 RepID=UPI000EA94B41|nr:glycosidase [Tsuneonella amylolytica]